MDLKLKQEVNTGKKGAIITFVAHLSEIRIKEMQVASLTHAEHIVMTHN